MADPRTVVTELITGLGMLGAATLEEALAVEPREMASVSPELWATLRELHNGGLLRAEFESAWANGQAFLASPDALRRRRPAIVEWKGASKAPGDEVVPADLRVDHVYFVSCKYLSKIVLNASPAYLFERLLTGGHGLRGPDWFHVVAESELNDLYAAAVAPLDLALPASPSGLDGDQRKELAGVLRGRWAPELRDIATEFATTVAERSATHWLSAMNTAAAREKLLLRLLRIGSAPYFVLGSDSATNLRLRIQTPWDWKQQYRLVSFDVCPQASEQPRVGWEAVVQDRRSGARVEVRGHVEIRWGHGKFNGSPEAKVYLDTPHHLVPGYVTIR